MRMEKQARIGIRKSILQVATAVGTLLFAIIATGVFTPSAHAQTFTALYAFTGSTDGGFPEGDGLILDSAGNIYGLTGEYGATETLNCTQLCGNVFELTPEGKETNLYTFNGGAQGYLPSGLALDKSGTFFGSVGYGGPKQDGFLFSLSKAGKLTGLHAFPSKPGDGEVPGRIFLDSAGNMYGLTATGGSGTGCGYGCGTVFRFSRNDKEAIVNLSAAAWAPSGLLLDAATQTLYGTTVLGGGIGCGGDGCGTVFKIDKTGKLTVLYKFQGVPDGSIPEGKLALDSAGNLYGMTWQGGNSGPCPPSGCGTVYKLDSGGEETILHKFSVFDGALPSGGVIIDSSGNLYGTTDSGGTAPNCQPSGCGTVFKVDTSGNETVLYSFTDESDGSTPIAGLVFDTAGNLYGTTFYGGYTGGDLCFPGGCGTVFKVTP
jgi:uncharacterized repeat protein (TIGR03803 family)